MRKSLAHSLNRDILVTFAVIAVLFMGIGALMQLQWKNDNIQTVCSFLDMLVTRERSNMANELFERRHAALRIRLAEISGHEGILEAILFDSSGVPVAMAAGGQDLGLEKGVAPFDPAGWGGGSGYEFEHDFSVLSFTRAVTAAGETLGWIRISHDLSLLRKQMFSFFAFFFLLLLITLVCMLVLLRRSLHRSVVTPLEELGSAMRRMDAGSLSVDVPRRQVDREIADLGAAFQELLARLERSYRDLDEANAALANSERRLSRAISASTDAVWQWSYRTGATYFSPRWYEMLGYEDQELPMTYETWRDLCHPEDFKEALKAIEETVLSGGAKPYKSEFRMRGKDGEWRWILDRGDIIERDEDGSPILFSGTHADITERKQAEERLRQSEEKFSQLFHLSPDGILLVEMDSGRFVDVNDTFVRLSGFSREEILGRTALELGFYRDENDRDKVFDRLGRFGHFRNLEFEALRKDGTAIVCSLSGQVLDLDGQSHVLAVIRDVSEMKKLHEIMMQNEKMRSVGGMAAGIAHEINNPLGIIMQAAHNLVQRTQPDFPKNREAAEEIGLNMDLLVRYMRARKLDVFIADIQKAGARAADIIRRMLDFSRLGESGRVQCDLRSVVEHALTLARSDYDLKKSYDFRKIEVIVEADPNLPAVSCTESEIEQVLLNLLRNAAQALAEVAPPMEHPRIGIRIEALPDGVRIVIEDNGPGMGPEVSARVFEPFYTTKAPGLGTGLGLSVSYFIITKGHGGSMRVESAPGQGTRFIIELPALRG